MKDDGLGDLWDVPPWWLAALALAPMAAFVAFLAFVCWTGAR